MREFFKPWRRRLGVVTLALSCAFAGLWLRSCYKIDECAILPRAGCQLIFISAYQQWGLKVSPGPPHYVVMTSEVSDLTGSCSTKQSTTFNEGTFFQHRESRVDDGVVNSLEFREHQDENQSEAILLYPYWSIVIPLTLLSAWLLLLTRPRVGWIRVA